MEMDYTAADSIVVKVSFNGDLRRFAFPKGPSFKALYEQVIAILGLEKATELVLKYADEEGDLITVSSDWELNSAIKPGQVLRLNASVKSSAPVAAPFCPSFANPADPFAVPDAFPASAPAVLSPPLFFGNVSPFGAHQGYFGPHGHFGGPTPFAPFGDAPQGHFAAPQGHFGGPSPVELVPFTPHPGHHGAPSHFGPHGHHGGPFRGGFGGGCGRGGRVSREEWASLKKEHKSHFSREDWAKIKEERKRACKEHKKMGKHGGRFAAYPGYFGPHGGHHGHPHSHFAHGCVDSETEKLTARFAKDVTIEDGSQIAGGTPFVKTWRIRNEGEAWPAGCVLRLLTKQSDSMMSQETVAVPFEGPVGTGQEFDISAPLVAPAKPGRYTAYFKMCTPAGKKFGQRLWVSIVVPSVSSSSSSDSEKEADKYESLVDTILAMGFNVKRHRVFRLLQKFDGDVAKTTEALQVKMQRKAHKEEKKALKKANKM